MIHIPHYLLLLRLNFLLLTEFTDVFIVVSETYMFQTHRGLDSSLPNIMNFTKTVAANANRINFLKQMKSFT